MRHLLLALLFLAGCWGKDAHIVEGVIIEKISETQILVDHKEIPGFMEAMVMPFRVQDPAIIAELKPGDRIVARLRMDRAKAYLEKIRVTGHAPLPTRPAGGPVPIRNGQTLAAHQVSVTDGSTWTVGQGQGTPTLLSFIYTRCPMPEVCPLTVSRLQSIQDDLKGKARILAITLDPDHDTLEVLKEYAAQASADPATWQFGRIDEKLLHELTLYAGMPFGVNDEGTIVHSIRFLLLDAEGKMIERYDDNAWPKERILQQLTTGAPLGPTDVTGTKYADATP